METKFSEQDSLRLINEMINQTKNNIQKGTADTIIFAGYFVTITAILNYLANILNFNNTSWLWLLMIPMTIGCKIINTKKKKKAIVKTHIDHIVNQIWLGFLISIVCTLITIFSYVIAFNSLLITMMITPSILILMGLSQYITASSIKFKDFRRGAYIFWIGALISVICIVLKEGNLQLIILAICTIVGFIIPGYKLNKKASKNV